MQYTLREATIADVDLLDLIYTENMKSYVEKNYPWNPQLFRDCFIPNEYQVVEINYRLIGFMKVVMSETEIYLGEIQIIKEFQKQGIGTSLTQSVIKEAQASNKKLWLRVLKSNPAKKLYKRLGFTELKESSTHTIMAKNT